MKSVSDLWDITSGRNKEMKSVSDLWQELWNMVRAVANSSVSVTLGPVFDYDYDGQADDVANILRYRRVVWNHLLMGTHLHMGTPSHGNTPSHGDTPSHGGGKQRLATKQKEI